jgi:hypothetical protein
MSSLKKYAKNEIGIAKTKVSHDATSITKDSSVRVGITETARVKIGLRIKATQSIERFEIKPAGSPTRIDLTEITDRTDWRYADVNGVFSPGSDDQWVLYTAPWTSYTDVVTTLKLKHEKPHDNGFQVVTVVATENSIPFADGHYIYGVSIIPGAANEREPSLGTVFGRPRATPKARAKPKGKRPARRKKKR